MRGRADRLFGIPRWYYKRVPLRLACGALGAAQLAGSGPLHALRLRRCDRFRGDVSLDLRQRGNGGIDETVDGRERSLACLGRDVARDSDRHVELLADHALGV